MHETVDNLSFWRGFFVAIGTFFVFATFLAAAAFLA